MTTLKSVKSNRKKLSKKKIFIKGSFKDKNGKTIKFINDDYNNQLILNY